ncbi:MAG: hypothetical protein NC823_01365 [Candidatus Omnitrophica bacterium]|nr:hypothetical protein [Candidatus Omnitrophota bacterium]
MNVNSGLPFFLLGLSGVMLTISLIFSFFNRKKAIFCLVLSLIYLGLSGYYTYLVVGLPAPPEVAKFIPATSEYPQLVMKINGQEFVAEPDHALTVKKADKIELVKATAPDGREIKANLVGFVANPAANDGQDIGVEITYEQLDKKRALGPGKKRFKVELRDGQKVLGNIYLDFSD